MGKSIVKCFVQPGDSIQPLLKAINGAKKSVEVIIFRFDRREIEKALAAAVSRGVHVHALIAYTNRGGEIHLRELEMRLLAAGVTVSRTDNDLVRYHGKLMIIDRRQLFLLAFNFTWLDIEHSRSFGVITTNRKHVQEAVKLFESDSQRRPYTPGSTTFLVSPLNARKALLRFIADAKHELLIYDPEISDDQMIRALEAREKVGVTVLIIGRLSGRRSALEARRMPGLRLHTRSIIRDGKQAFVGSQSLRALELDARREVGIVFRDPKVIARLTDTFRADWDMTDRVSPEAPPVADAPNVGRPPAASVAKKVARAIVSDLGPVAPVLEMAVKQVTGYEAQVDLNTKEIETTVKDAVKEAVKEVVRVAVEEAVESEKSADGAGRV
jgi:phosphatidylserine/phosphatidylglycerophosphate/cardiolipin synthase-like enzyme